MYRIELREYPLVWFTAHAFWVLYDGDDLIGELHGFATDHKTGRWKTIGTARDALRAWSYPLPGQPSRIPSTGSANGGFSGIWRPGQASRSVFEADRADALARWDRGLLAAQALNDANIGYSLLGGAPDDITTGNSNTVFRTFGDVMDLQMPKVKALVRPGERKNVLPRQTYAGLYDDTRVGSDDTRVAADDARTSAGP